MPDHSLLLLEQLHAINDISEMPEDFPRSSPMTVQLGSLFLHADEVLHLNQVSGAKVLCVVACIIGALLSGSLCAVMLMGQITPPQMFSDAPIPDSVCTSASEDDQVTFAAPA